MPRAIAPVCLVLALGIGGPAGADEPVWQPFVLTQDASTLRGGSAAVETGAGYSGVNHQAGAPGAPSDALGELWLRGAVGLTDRIELQGSAGMTASGDQGRNFDHGRAEARFRLLDHPLGAPLVLTLSGGWQTDYRHDQAAESTLAVSVRPGAFHFAGSLQAAHYFRTGRDAVDMAISAGATYQLTRGVELGVEYLGEELEGILGDDDVDIGQGGRQWVGPSGSAAIAGTPLRLNVGAGALWTNARGGAFVRGSLGYVF